MNDHIILSGKVLRGGSSRAVKVPMLCPDGLPGECRRGFCYISIPLTWDIFHTTTEQLRLDAIQSNPSSQLGSCLFSKNRDSVTSLGNLCQRSVTLRQSLLCFCLYLLPLVLSLGSTEEPECLLFSPVLQVLMYIDEIPLSFSSPSWTLPSLSASPHRRDILVPALSSWPFSGLFPVAPFLLHWGQTRTHHFRCYFSINDTNFLSLMVPLNHHQQTICFTKVTEVGTEQHKWDTAAPGSQEELGGLYFLPLCS